MCIYLVYLYYHQIKNLMYGQQQRVQSTNATYLLSKEDLYVQVFSRFYERYLGERLIFFDKIFCNCQMLSSSCRRKIVLEVSWERDTNSQCSLFFLTVLVVHFGRSSKNRLIYLSSFDKNYLKS